jgi:small GTP-binding protein
METKTRLRSWSIIETENIPSLKISIVGDCGVGKTTFVQSLLGLSKSVVPKPNTPESSPANGNSKGETKSRSSTLVPLDNEHEFNIYFQHAKHGLLGLRLFDTAGEERFRSITSTFYRGTDMVMVMFDLNDIETFENVTKWLQDAERYSSQGIPQCIVANKKDLISVEKFDHLITKMREAFPYHYLFVSQATDPESVLQTLEQVSSIAFDDSLRRKEIRSKMYSRSPSVKRIQNISPKAKSSCSL